MYTKDSSKITRKKGSESTLIRITNSSISASLEIIFLLEKEESPMMTKLSLMAFLTASRTEREYFCYTQEKL